jgi:hypothetical protein
MDDALWYVGAFLVAICLAAGVWWITDLWMDWLEKRAGEGK